MPRTLISLGANLGNVRESMHAAKRLLQEVFGASHTSFSRLYRTPPIGGPEGQGDFLNAVVAIDTQRSVWEVWEAIKSIETSLGRQRLQRWEARRIDIDVLLYDQQRIWTPHFKVPHPRMCMRTFVIQPAMDVAADWIDPVTEWTIQQLHQHLLQSQSTPHCIQVVMDREARLQQIRERFETFSTSLEQDSKQSNPSHPVRWQLASIHPSDSQNNTSNKPSQEPQALPTKLTIAAVASPDPATVLWEDYSRPWVRWLHLDASLPTTAEPWPLHGPRYLMPADDIDWAVHEILAADQAMQGWVEPIDSL